MVRRPLATARVVRGILGVLVPPLLLGACEVAFPLVENDGLPDGSTPGSDGGTNGLPADASGSNDGQGPAPSGDGSNTNGADGADGGVPSEAGNGPTAIYSGLNAPLGIALDTTGDVCWVAGQSVRGLYCAPTAGGDAGAIRKLDDANDAQWLVDAFDLALDATYVYWSNGPNNNVVRKALSGGTAASYFTGDNRVSYIAVTGSGQVWASDYVAPDASSGAIVVGPSGGQSTEAYPLQPGESGIALWQTQNTVYWGRSDGLAFGVQSTSGSPPTIIKFPETPVGGVAVDSAGTVYFIVGDQKIYRLTSGSSSPQLLYDAMTPFGDSDIAVDDAAVYFSQHDLGTIMRMGK
jgi:hypothetical protein